MHITHTSLHLSTVALTVIVTPLKTLKVTVDCNTDEVCKDSSLVSCNSNSTTRPPVVVPTASLPLTTSVSSLLTSACEVSSTSVLSVVPGTGSLSLSLHPAT